jgi:UDPglucose 6-dehydrogenase
LPELVVVPTVAEAVEGADAAVVATEWPIYAELDWEALRDSMRRPLIVDGKRLLPEAELRSLGFRVERIGDGVEPAAALVPSEAAL